MVVRPDHCELIVATFEDDAASAQDRDERLGFSKKEASHPCGNSWSSDEGSSVRMRHPTSLRAPAYNVIAHYERMSCLEDLRFDKFLPAILNMPVSDVEIAQNTDGLSTTLPVYFWTQTSKVPHYQNGQS